MTISRRGHTFVELLVAVPIFAIMALVINQFLLASLEGLATVSAHQTLQSQLSRAMREVLTDVQMAANWTDIGGNCSAGGNTYVTSAAVLCLQLPALDTTGQPISDTTIVTDQVLYVFNLDTLTRIVTPGTCAAPMTCSRLAATQVIARNLAGTTFTLTTSYASPDRLKDVTCTLAGSRTERGRLYSQTLTSRARLRNYRQ